MNKMKKILLCALLIAASIVIGRLLSIRTPIITIGFAFIPMMLIGIILGWKYSSLAGGISDVIGALLFPVGAFFPGFTVSGILTGLLYGLFLHNDKEEFKVNKKFIIKLIICVILVTGIINGILNTLWILIITKFSVKVILLVRIGTQLVMAPIMIIVMMTLSKLLEKHINKFQDM